MRDMQLYQRLRRQGVPPLRALRLAEQPRPHQEPKPDVQLTDETVDKFMRTV